MKKYTSRLRRLRVDEPSFYLPPYKVEKVLLSLSESIDWGIELLGIPNFWKHTKGKGITVAILDTGIALNHPDLKDAILDTKDFTDSLSGVYDQEGHGTHVAGIVAARNNGHGVIGVAPECKLLIGKVLGDNGFGKADAIAAGIEWAIASGADIISMSLGSNAPFPIIQKAIEKAIDKNVFVIAAAGNDGLLDNIDYPGAYEGVITVGSIDRRKQLSSFSDWGVEVDVVAPGDEITSTYPPNITATISGTSMATPFVAGVAALVLSKHRQYGGKTKLETQEQMRKHLIKTAIDLGPNGFDKGFGFGLLNPVKLAELVP